MNLEQVSHYIAHPHELGPNDAPALKEMSEKHPYAAVFSLLYLTALANGKSVDLDDALQQHAYRLSDRTKLYHLVNGRVAETTESGAPSTTVTAEPPTASSAVSERPTEQTTAPKPATNEETVVPEEPAAPAQTALSDQPFTDEATASFSATEEELSDVEGTAPAEEEPLEDTLSLGSLPAATEEPSPTGEAFDRVTEAFSREQHFDLSVEEPITDAHSDAETEIPAAADSAIEEPAGQENISSSEEETATSSSVSGEQTLQSGAPRSFTSWLKTGSTKTASLQQPEEKPAIQEPAPAEKKRVDEIIENFIKEEPSITRSKAEFFSPSRKAKESLDEDAVPVSETLAKIYAAQGNYPKAIHVYHQLLLSFPEKRRLFAVQIEILKKKITP